MIARATGFLQDYTYACLCMKSFNHASIQCRMCKVYSLWCFSPRNPKLARRERYVLGFILDRRRSSSRYSSTFNYHPYVVLKNSYKTFNQSSRGLVHSSTHSTSDHEGQELHGIARLVYRYSDILSPQL
ncbi:uncharacterized protein LOC125500227 [Athalia rosae]|uniref:uncharacterized protein LOC125500227 n=1 Tax=Athalia rosae TaxID=37344 RepID=UPI0020348F6C|nr:uncharacterized protein LOC125500227 [Athalia rosae]